MASYREEEDPFEEDIVFDQAGLLNSTTKMNTAIRRVSSGKCALFAKTLGLCGAFFGLGLCIAIPGPTFLSPITELKADTSPITSIYAARSSGYLVGSIIGGFLFDHFNRLFLLFISLLLTAVFITVTPWCHVLWLLEACMVFLGMTMGFLDTGGNVLCLDLWGRNSGPFMQALHFSFGLGAFVAPLLAAPFLEPAATEISPNITTNASLHFQMSNLHLREMDREKRDVLSNETIKSFINNIQFSSNSWHNSTIKTSESPSTASYHDSYTETPTTTVQIEIKTTSGLNINEITSQSVTTTQRVPKPKPSKTKASSLGTTNWEKVRIRKPPQEDLVPITSTSMPTMTSTLPSTVSTTLSFVPSNSENYTKSSLPNKFSDFQTGETESNTNPNSTNNTDGSQMEGKNTSNKIIPTSEISFNMNNTMSSSLNASSNIDSEWTQQFKNKSSNTLNVGDTFNTSTDLVSGLNFSRRIDTDASLQSYLSSYSQLKVTPPNEKAEEIYHYTYYKTSSEYTPPITGGTTESQLELSVNEDGVIQESPINKVNEEYSFSGKKDPTIFPTDSPSFEKNSIASSHSDVFQTENPLSKHVHHSKPVTYDNDTEVINSFLDIVANRIGKYGFSKVQFTYFMVGLFVFTISLVFLGFLCHNPRDPKSKQEDGQGIKKISNKALHALMISLMAVFFLLYVGLEVTYGQLVLAFAVHGNLQLARSTGLVIAIVFWGSFAAMRFASIFFSSGFGPITMLLLNFVFCTLGTILLSTMASHTEMALWVGTALLAIGLASVFPTGILWIERYIHISNKVAAAFVMGASLGEMVCPVAVYRLMVTNPAMLMHSAVTINVLCILTFAALQWLAHRHGEKYCNASNNGYQLASQEEEEDMIDMSPSGSVVTLRQHSFSSEHRALLNGTPHRGP